MKKTYQLVAIVACALAICSCEKQGPSVISSSEVTPLENSTVASRAEFSSLLEKVLSEESAAESIAALILENGGVKQSLTFDEILELKNGSDVRTAGLSRTFCNAVVSEITSNTAKYPIASERTAVLTKGGDMTDEDLKNLDVELYIPYSRYHDADTEDEVTVIYAPEDEFAMEVEGVKINRAGERSYVASVNDEYTRENMTIAVLPKDTTNYIHFTSDEDLNNKLTGRFDKIPDDGLQYIILPPDDDSDSGSGSGSGSGSDSNNDPRDGSTLPNGLITVNITDSETIDEDDILYTNLARIRVRNTSWCGFISNKLKLAIYRTSADYTVGDDNIPKIVPGQHFLGVIPIYKSQIDAQEWIVVNTIFDDDWDLHEYDQELFLCSEHNLRMDKAEMSGDVTLGYYEEKGGFSAEAGISASFTFTANASRLRVNNELTRKSILATNLSDMGSGTLEVNGHDYAIRNYGGVVDMVFTQYYTRYND